MSNIIQEALANCTAIPEDSNTKELLNFFVNYINKYGIFLKDGNTLSVNLLITGGFKAFTFNLMLTPPDKSYGNYSESLEGIPFGRNSLANFFKNIGCEVTFNEDESKLNEQFDCYTLTFTIPK